MEGLLVELLDCAMATDKQLRLTRSSGFEYILLPSLKAESNVQAAQSGRWLRTPLSQSYFPGVSQNLPTPLGTPPKMTPQCFWTGATPPQYSQNGGAPLAPPLRQDGRIPRAHFLFGRFFVGSPFFSRVEEGTGKRSASQSHPLLPAPKLPAQASRAGS